MGNEFGHPEWIDFPREGNNWSYKYARRQWSLSKNNDLKYQFLGEFDREMLMLERNGTLLNERHINRLIENTFDKVIAFTRGDYLFIFNFHPANSYTDYGIKITGKFRVVLDSDDILFGGFNRFDRSLIYSSVRKAERATINVPFRLYLYLPSRTALVFRKEAIRRVTDI
jgi:1,4-alpha-glucan branching enzyme